MAFAPHGRWQMATLGQLFCYRIYGAWNAEGARAWKRNAAQLAEPLVASPWAILGDLRQWDLSTIDSVPIIRRATELAVASGNGFQCLLVGEAELKRHLIDSVVPVDYPGMHRVIVEDMDQAIDALMAAGFADEARQLRECGFDALLDQGLSSI